MYRGVDAKHDVKRELVAQNITTTPDASIPNVQVKDAATAESMARIINHHSLEATGGKTYSELGRYVAADGTDTNDANAAVKGADGKPVANPIRNTAFQASSLETSLWSSVLAFNVADLVVGLGVMVIVLGLAVGGVGVALGAWPSPSWPVSSMWSRLQHHIRPHRSRPDFPPSRAAPGSGRAPLRVLAARSLRSEWSPARRRHFEDGRWWHPVRSPPRRWRRSRVSIAC